MKNILIPFDFSEVSLNALEYAVQFAGKDPSMQLFLLHVDNNQFSEENVQSKFKKAVAKYKKPLNPQFHTLTKQGELIPNIIEIQKELAVDLIIMGTSGADGNGEEIATRTSKFVQEADLPVLVIPESTKYFRLKTISVTVGQEKILDTTPLSVLLDVARKFQAEVHVLTVHKDEVYMGYSPEDETNENILQYYLEDFYSHHSFSENEDIEKGIMEYIEKHEIDMLAIMPRTHLKTEAASEGKLTRMLTLHTNIPLLVLD
ncbi:MAG: universal stress protein [Salegentibacter sp.]